MPQAAALHWPPPSPRALDSADLAGLLEVQRACYGPQFLESHETYARRLRHANQCSLVMVESAASSGSTLLAYLAAYDGKRGTVTPLNGDFCTALEPDTLVLHDMAVLPRCAGHGLAQALLEHCWRLAITRGMLHSALVAVQGSQRFWERHGYQARAVPGVQAAQRLAAYGDGALYMERPLPSV